MRQGARCVQAQRRPNRCLRQWTYTQSQVALPVQPCDKEAGWRHRFKGQQTHIISKVSFKYRIQLRLGWPKRPLLFLLCWSGRIHTWGSWFWFAPVPNTPAATTERSRVDCVSMSSTVSSPCMSQCVMGHIRLLKSAIYSEDRNTGTSLLQLISIQLTSDWQ